MSCKCCFLIISLWLFNISVNVISVEHLPTRLYLHKCWWTVSFGGRRWRARVLLFSWGDLGTSSKLEQPYCSLPAKNAPWTAQPPLSEVEKGNSRLTSGSRNEREPYRSNAAQQRLYHRSGMHWFTKTQNIFWGYANWTETLQLLSTEAKGATSSSGWNVWKITW